MFPTSAKGSVPVVLQHHNDGLKAKKDTQQVSFTKWIITA